MEPCTHFKLLVRDALSVSKIGESSYRFGKPIRHIRFVRLLGIVSHCSDSRFVLDDGTGSITVHNNSKSSELKVGAMVDILGEIRDKENQRIISCSSCRIEDDPNWQIVRSLEIIKLYKEYYFPAGIPSHQPQIVPGSGPVSSSFVPSWSFMPDAVPSQQLSVCESLAVCEPPADAPSPPAEKRRPPQQQQQQQQLRGQPYRGQAAAGLPGAGSGTPGWQSTAPARAPPALPTRAPAPVPAPAAVPIDSAKLSGCVSSCVHRAPGVEISGLLADPAVSACCAGAPGSLAGGAVQQALNNLQMEGAIYSSGGKFYPL